MAIVAAKGGLWGGGGLRHSSTAEAEAVPMGEINTTPLVDVMLVLLVMLIITVPISTHAVKLDLPSGPTPPVHVDPVVNDLAIEASGAVRWNGEAVTRAQLRLLLATSAAMPDEPELHLDPDADAPYAVVDSILVDAKRAEVRRMGFAGNQNYAGVF